MRGKSGRRRMGRIRTHPARQAKRDKRARNRLRSEGTPENPTVTRHRLYNLAVRKLPIDWLQSAWKDGAPFKEMAARHVKEAAERKNDREES